MPQGYLAYDDKNFYFAAKDRRFSTPDPGTVRFASRNDDDYFYPETSYAKSNGSKSFSIRWTGQVQPKYSETYTFTTTSDDGIRLWINGKPLVDNWTDGSTDDSGSLALQAGKKYDLKTGILQQRGWGSGQAVLAEPESGPRDHPCRLSCVNRPGPDGAVLYERGFRSSRSRVWTPPSTLAGPGETPDPSFGAATLDELHWPAGVRRYSYRKDPELPAGNSPGHDNVQIAFNVLPPDRKYMLPNPPGVMPHFTTYADTDYEYALNQVAPAVRRRYGDMAACLILECRASTFYPRQPKSPQGRPGRWAANW